MLAQGALYAAMCYPFRCLIMEESRGSSEVELGWVEGDLDLKRRELDRSLDSSERRQGIYTNREMWSGACGNSFLVASLFSVRCEARPPVESEDKG